LVTKDLCLGFIVKKKWDSGEAIPVEQAAQRIPEYLYAHVDICGERMVCAVPTDVEDGRRYARLKPCAYSTVTAETSAADVKGHRGGVLRGARTRRK